MPFSQGLRKVATSLRRRDPTATLSLIKKNILHEARWYLDRSFDRRYGTDTSRVIDLSLLQIASEDLEHGVYYEPTPVRVFHQILRSLAIAYEQFTFCDLGSGLGRTLLLASDYPFRSIVGVEFSEVLDRYAKQNIHVYRSKSQKCFSIQSVCMDAATFPIPPGPLLFYLYNPFLPPVMARVVTNIKESLDREPRPAFIAYYNPLSAHVIEDFAFLPCKRELELSYDYTREIQRKATVYYNQPEP